MKELRKKILKEMNDIVHSFANIKTPMKAVVRLRTTEEKSYTKDSERVENRKNG